jgi:Tfp pilus assembly protein PilN
MVDINLIPQSLRKAGKEGALPAVKIAPEIVLGVGSGLVLFLVAVHLVLGFFWLIAFGQMAAHNAQWQKLAPDKQALDAISSQSADFKKKEKVLSDLTTKSMLWAPKFNAISDALPKGVWIRRMTFDKTGLSIDGSVVSRTESGISNVGLFVSNLRQDNGFIKDFAFLEVNSIQRGKMGSVDVTQFTVMAKLKDSK